jgi:glycosyltransferase involved in cell wall biosynthesis
VRYPLVTTRDAGSIVDQGPARRPLHVLHVAQPALGGVAEYVSGAAIDQSRRGWRVSVAAPPGGLVRRRLEEARADVSFRPWTAGRGVARLRQDVHSLAGLIRDVAPDVIHLHSSTAGAAGRLAVRGALPTIFQPHAWSWQALPAAAAPALRAGERWALRWTSAVVCVGVEEAEEGRRAGFGKRIRIIRNGVDLAHFRPPDHDARATTRATYGIPADGPVVVCVGRRTRQKGQDVLLAAWPAVRRACPDAVLVLVGDAQEGAVVRPPTEQPGVRVQDAADDVRPWYAAADVVAVPSRWEGLSLTVIEAMASGRPVVASDVPGVRETLRDGVSTPVGGALVPPEDPQALARALVTRLCDPGLRRREGCAARRRAEDFDIRATHDALADLTAELGRVRAARSASGTPGRTAGSPGTHRRHWGSSR